MDDEADYGWPVWAVVIPIAVTATDPLPDPALEPGFSPPMRSPADRAAATSCQNGQ